MTHLPLQLAVGGRLRDRSRRGFTLVELLVVVIIIGITLTLSIEFMPWLLAENRLTSTGRRLASFVTDVRDEAVVFGKPIRIEYQLGDSKDDPQFYRAVREPDPGKEDDFEDMEYELVLHDWLEIPEDVRLQAVMLGPDDEITEGYYSVIARPDGSITPHGIALYSDELEAWGTVRVNGLLGEARFDVGLFEPDIVDEDSF